jgi:transporter family-2 protein
VGSSSLSSIVYIRGGPGVQSRGAYVTRACGEDHAKGPEFEEEQAMDRGLALTLTIGAGILVALQAPINGGLAKATGGLPAALVSFAVGALAVALLVVVFGKAGGLGSVGNVQWYYLTGGLLGAVYVCTVLVTVGSIGAGGVAAACVAGELAASVAIDRLGLFGLDQVPLSPQRLLGVGLLFAGTALVIR